MVRTFVLVCRFNNRRACRFVSPLRDVFFYGYNTESFMMIDECMGKNFTVIFAVVDKMPRSRLICWPSFLQRGLVQGERWHCWLSSLLSNHSTTYYGADEFVRSVEGNNTPNRGPCFFLLLCVLDSTNVKFRKTILIISEIYGTKCDAKEFLDKFCVKTMVFRIHFFTIM